MLRLRSAEGFGGAVGLVLRKLMAQPSAGTRLGGDTTGLTRDVSGVISCALSQYQHRGSLTTTVGLGRGYSRCSEFIHSRSDSRRCLCTQRMISVTRVSVC